MISVTKRSGCIPQLTLVMGIVIVAVMAFQKKTKTDIEIGYPNKAISGSNVELHLGEKQYHVTLTPDEWQMRLQFLDNAKQIMAKSTLPSNVVSQWSDSLTKFQQEIVAQVQKQMADTTHKK